LDIALAVAESTGKAMNDKQHWRSSTRHGYARTPSAWQLAAACP